MSIAVPQIADDLMELVHFGCGPLTPHPFMLWGIWFVVKMGIYDLLRSWLEEPKSPFWPAQFGKNDVANFQVI